MDIAIIGNNSIRIKSKGATFVVDPAKDMPKTASDAIILLNGEGNVDISRITDSRIIINGPGGYEIGGVKISGTTTPNGILYRLSLDGINVIIGKTIESKAEGFSSCQVLITNADTDFKESFVTTLEPKITVLYGDKKTESAKTLGAENVTPVARVTVTKDKIPEKMEVVVLG